jgi:hypothetical protein
VPANSCEPSKPAPAKPRIVCLAAAGHVDELEPVPFAALVAAVNGASVSVIGVK